MKLLVKLPSWGAGDALCITPVLPELCKKYNVEKVDVNTYFPDIFLYNPYVKNIIKWGDPLSSYDKVIDLDLGSKQGRNLHQTTEYAKLCGIDLSSIEPIIYLTDLEKSYATKLLRPFRGKVVVSVNLQMARTSWQGRNWNYDYILPLINLLKGYFGDKIEFIELGAKVNFSNSHHSFNLVNKTTMRELFAVSSLTDFFIGIDSFVLHVIQAFNKKGVLLSGATDPKLRITNFDNISYVSNEELSCIYCYNKGLMPDSCTCNRLDEVCMTSLTPEVVFEKVKNKLNEDFYN